jgi:hypothetical protein
MPNATMVKIKTRPQNTTPTYPPPDCFYRVTDSTSFFQYAIIARTRAPDPHCAFSIDGYDAWFKYYFPGNLHKVLSAQTILERLERESPAEEGDWDWFIGVYDNKDTVKKEVDKRKAMGRKSIKVWMIDGKYGNWRKSMLQKEMEDGQLEEVEIDVVTDFASDFGYDVMFISVAELVRKLGFEERLKGKDIGGEWFALEWIPKERVTLLQTLGS